MSLGEEWADGYRGRLLTHAAACWNRGRRGEEKEKPCRDYHQSLRDQLLHDLIFILHKFNCILN